MSSDRSFSFPLDMSYEYDVRSTARAQKPAREDTYSEDEAESFSSYLEQNRQEDPRRSKPADAAQNTASAAGEHQPVPAAANKTSKKKSGQAQETAPAQTQNAESQPSAQTKETENKKEAASAPAAAAAHAAKGNAQVLPAEQTGKKTAKADAAAQQAKTQQTAPQAAEMPVNQAAKTAAAPAAETAQNIAAAAQTGAPKETGPAKTGAAPETVPPQPLAARAPMANDPRLQNQAANGKDASAQTGTGEEAKAAKAGTQIAAQTQGALPQQNTAAPQSPQLGLSQPAPLFGAPGSDAPLTSPAGAEGTVGNASTAAVSDGQARFTQLSNMQTGNVVTAPRMTAQVGDALVHAARSGNDKLTLQLFPEELGTVDITLEMQNGRLKIVVAAERPETQQQLQQNQRDLERSLAEAGIDHGNADLSFAEWEGREQREPGTAFERLSFGVAAAEPAETATGQTVSLTPGGIDLRL